MAKTVLTRKVARVLHATQIDDVRALEEVLSASKLQIRGEAASPPYSNTGGKGVVSGPVLVSPDGIPVLRSEYLDGLHAREGTRASAFLRAVWAPPVAVAADSDGEQWHWRDPFGRLQRVRVPLRSKSLSALVDTLTFTFPERHLATIPALEQGVSDSDVCRVMGLVLGPMLSIDVGPKIAGRNYYAVAHELVWRGRVDSVSVGYVAAGGNADTVCVHLTGEGCAKLSRSQWVALYAFLVLVDARITRVDCAHDDFSGDASLEFAMVQFGADLFRGKGAPPTCSQVGDWLTERGAKKGRTFYVGTRQSGKVMRIYEKGRQLGDPDSRWVRWELELHGDKKRPIPLDILLRPGDYLAGAYPATEWVSEVQAVVACVKKALQISYKSLTEHCRRAYGRFLWVVSELEGAEGLARLFRDDGPPKRLVVPH